MAMNPSDVAIIAYRIAGPEFRIVVIVASWIGACRASSSNRDWNWMA